jgi:hypothetical protein
MTVARAARYSQLVNEAADQLKCRAGSELARHVGALRLARETFTERLIGGRDVDPSDLLKLDEALARYVPKGEAPTLTITYVDGTRKTCPFCHVTFNPHDANPKPLPPDDE